MSNVKEARAIETPFNTEKMRPYLSPPRTAEQIQPTCQEQWGSYKSKATSSSNLDRWQHEDNKVPHDPITPKITAASTPTTSLSKCVTPKIANRVKTSEVQPSTSKGETDKYERPKISRQGIQSSKLNEYHRQLDQFFPRSPT